MKILKAFILLLLFATISLASDPSTNIVEDYDLTPYSEKKIDCQMLQIYRTIISDRQGSQIQERDTINLIKRAEFITKCRYGSCFTPPSERKGSRHLMRLIAKNGRYFTKESQLFIRQYIKSGWIIKDGQREELYYNKFDEAISKNDIITVKKLLHTGQYTNEFGCDLSTYIYLAISMKRLEIVNLLLANGASTGKLPNSIVSFYNMSIPINQYNNLFGKLNSLNAELPYVTRIRKIDKLVQEKLSTILSFDKISDELLLPPEIIFLIFKDSINYFNLSLTSKYFYNIIIDIIKREGVLWPMDIKIRFLLKNEIEIPPIVTCKELEDLAKKII